MFVSAAGLAVLGADKPCFIQEDHARQQHRHNHGWTMLCSQLSQQTQNELQTDTSFFYVPTHKPTDLTEYVGLTGSTWQSGPAGQSQAWAGFGIKRGHTGRPISAQTQRKPTKKAIVSAKVLNRNDHILSQKTQNYGAKG